MNHLSRFSHNHHHHPVCEVDVQHRLEAKNCRDCCCVNHCVFTGHDWTDTSPHNCIETAMEYKFPTKLGKCWKESENYEQDMLSLVEDKLMFLLCGVNTDFNETGLNLIASVDISYQSV